MRARYLICSLSAVLLGVALRGGGTAWAQTQPKPYGAEQPPPPAFPSGDDAYNNSANNNYPAVEVRAIPEADVRYTVAREQYWRAQHDLGAAIERAKHTFDTSPDLLQAARAERDAWQTYQEAREQALQPVRTDPEYRAAVALKQQLAQQIQDQRQARRPDQARIYALAVTKLHYASVATNREIGALDRDSQVQQAKQRLADAAARISELRVRFEQQVRQDPELTAARNAVEDARITYLAAASYRDAAREARDIALNYNYDTYQYSPYRFYSPALAFPDWYWRH